MSKKELRYNISFKRKHDALKRIDFLIDAHIDVDYVSCTGCEKCEEIELLRKSIVGDIVGKRGQKKGYDKRTLSDEKRKLIKQRLAAGDLDYVISRELSVSLNTVEFYRREMMDERRKDGR